MRLLTSIALAVTIASSGHAQSIARTVAPGDSVRVVLLDGTKLPGRLDFTTDSTIMLRGAAFGLPRHGVERIEVPAGPLGLGARARRGAKWGFLVGAVVGLLSSASESGGGGGPGSYTTTTTGGGGEFALLFAALGGLVGAPIGAIIGTAIPGTSWEAVTIPSATLSR